MYFGTAVEGDCQPFDYERMGYDEELKIARILRKERTARSVLPVAFSVNSVYPLK